MQTPPIQVATDDDIEMLTTVSKLIKSGIPKGGHFVCLLLIPGGETGVMVRLATSVGRRLARGYMLEAAIAMGIPNAGISVPFPQDN